MNENEQEVISGDQISSWKARCTLSELWQQQWTGYHSHCRYHFWRYWQCWDSRWELSRAFCCGCTSSNWWRFYSLEEFIEWCLPGNMPTQGKSKVSYTIYWSINARQIYPDLPNFTVLKTIYDFVTPSHHNGKLAAFPEYAVTSLKLRLNPSIQDLAYRFEVSNSRIVLKWLTVMDVRLNSLILWPERADLRRTMPKCFRAWFGDTVAVISVNALLMHAWIGISRECTYTRVTVLKVTDENLCLKLVMVLMISIEVKGSIIGS